MDIRTMADINKKNLAQEFGRYIREPWYFETWYEKIILILLGLLGMWNVYGWIF